MTHYVKASITSSRRIVSLYILFDIELGTLLFIMCEFRIASILRGSHLYYTFAIVHAFLMIFFFMAAI